MNDSKAQIGLIGLGVMGANLARNFASRGIITAVFNRTYEKTEEFLKYYQNNHLRGFQDIKDFISSLERPRKILLMVQAGSAVDAVIEGLTSYLEEGDILIDGGNSEYRDTSRRSRFLEQSGIHFVGMGVSGGEEGALHGPSLMPGGPIDAWNAIQPLVEQIAAKDFASQPCVTYIGPEGAGHFIKMVHNGIEYALMQLMAETYDLLRKIYHLNAAQIGDIFEKFSRGKLKSFLFEIAVPVLKQKDDQSENFLVDMILDKAGQKGTGAWTAIDALQRGIPLSTITEAVFARGISAEKGLRTQLSVLYAPSDPPSADEAVNANTPPKTLKELSSEELLTLENALYLGMILCYAQGLHLIRKASLDYHWSIDLAEVCRIWQGGCIIRSDFLKTLTLVYKKNKDIEHLLLAPEIAELLNASYPDFQKICLLAITHRLPLPSFLASLSYFESFRSQELSANFIQGLRDFFGAHTFERKDKLGAFHFPWNGSKE